MEKIKLSLDIGTNSIGWCVLKKEYNKYHFFKKYDDKGKLIPSKGVYIFPKGASANENSKAAVRRGFRGARRRIDRIRLRKVATLKVLSQFEMCPRFKAGELNKWKNKKIYPNDNSEFIEWQRTGKKRGNPETEKLKQPYYLRYLAAVKPGLMETTTGRHQLGRVFYHFAQRRGYWSNSETEQNEDAIELFKTSVKKLLDESNSVTSFYELFNILLKEYKKDKKVKRLGKKITSFLKKDSSIENLKHFIQIEFNKKENLGKVASSIKELTLLIEKSKQPTMGCYFNSIYSNTNKDGITERIRGRYTDREAHYLYEFNYICDKQRITGELRDKLHNAIFYQRPLKSQKGLVANCPLDPKRKRIAISHPLFEKFRMWESINRIKIKTFNDSRLRPLNTEEKRLIVPLFQRKNDFEFQEIAEKLSPGKSIRYIKDKKTLTADVEFNFPMDKTFSGSPTTYSLKRVIGKDNFNLLPFLNTGHIDQKGKKQVSVEDIWHCLFVDSFGKKDKTEARKHFAIKHLHLDDEKSDLFSRIQLKKGYGRLSKSAIKKIVPLLEKGKLYSHAVFQANISNVLGRTLTEQELQNIEETISEALQKHKYEKSINSIVNNYIDKYKSNNDSFGNNENSISIHRKGIKSEINNWFTKQELNKLKEKEIVQQENDCWNKFKEAVTDKLPKNVTFISTRTIPEIIGEFLSQKFPNDHISIDKLYHPSAIEVYPKADKELGNPEINSIRNPVFTSAMYQIRRLVNTLISVGMINKNTVVNIELAREINSASYRRALTQYQKDQQTIRSWAEKKIIECYNETERKNITPTPNQVTKFILYSEQNHRCLYSSETISPREFLTEQMYDIEHTIPRSLNNDNSLSNKTLANANFNRNYKKDILPAKLDSVFKNKNSEYVTVDKISILMNRANFLRSYAISNNEVLFNVTIKTLKDNYTRFKKAAKYATDTTAHDNFMYQAHYTKLKLDYLIEKYKHFEVEEVPAKFTHANLVDTRIITKYARAYLNSYFNRVNVVNGKITDMLRKIWGLQPEYEEKNRSNHIHHCIDAITVACVERGTANKMSEAFHKYEYDYFNGNDGAKVLLPEPMANFVATMKNLHKEVFIFHLQKDKIKPLMEELKKEKQKKLDLRGPLNSQNPYGLVEIKGEKKYVQRKPISSISGKDIENIVDENIKKRLLTLANIKGWECLMVTNIKDGEDAIEKEREQKKDMAFKIYQKLKKAKANKNTINLHLSVNDMPADFNKADELKSKFFYITINDGLDGSLLEKYKEKVNRVIDEFIRTKGLDNLRKENKGHLILPPANGAGTMVINKIRLIITKNVDLNPIKERRKLDLPTGKTKEYRRFFYFDKEAGSNYEAIIYGDLIPNAKGKIKRDYRLINHFNIVKNIFPKESELPVLYKIHKGDMFIVFDKHYDEINWNDLKELQFRLFKNVKFNENGILVFERHNYALGDVNHAKPVKEPDLFVSDGVVLRKSPSTFRAIPTKVDVLGRIDVDYSKNFIENYLQQ